MREHYSDQFTSLLPWRIIDSITSLGQDLIPALSVQSTPVTTFVAARFYLRSFCPQNGTHRFLDSVCLFGPVNLGAPSPACRTSTSTLRILCMHPGTL